MLEIVVVQTELLADAIELATPPPPNAEVTEADRLIFDAVRRSLHATFEAEPDPDVAASIRPLYERLEVARLRLYAAEGLFPRQLALQRDEHARHGPCNNGAQDRPAQPSNT